MAVCFQRSRKLFTSGMDTTATVLSGSHFSGSMAGRGSLAQAQKAKRVSRQTTARSLRKEKGMRKAGVMARSS
jgi:hypothetical protein